MINLHVIAPRALFSPILYPGTKCELDRMNRFRLRDMATENYTRRLTTVILNLVQPGVETFDPPYHRTKHEVDRLTRCQDMAVRNFPKCEVGRSVVGPQYYIVLVHSSSLR